MTIMGCSPCCNTCTIYTNDFTVNDLATNWSVSSGSFSISGGTLNVTSAGTIINTVAGTTGHGNLSCDFTASSGGVTFTFIGAYVDANNYLRLEVFYSGSSSTIKLFKKVSGTDTQIDTTKTLSLTAGGTYTAHLCWNGTHAVGSVAFTTTPAATARGDYTGTGNKIGLAGSSTLCKFDNITFSKTSVDDSACPACVAVPCSSFCIGNQISEFIQVDLGSFGNLTGSYVITAGDSSAVVVSSACVNGSNSYSTGGSCPIGDPQPSITCGGIGPYFWGIDFSFLGTGPYTIQVVISVSGIGGGSGVYLAVYQKTGLSASDCLNFNQLSIPLVCHNSIATPTCDGTGSTCKITSL